MSFEYIYMEKFIKMCEISKDKRRKIPNFHRMNKRESLKFLSFSCMFSDENELQTPCF